MKDWTALQTEICMNVANAKFYAFVTEVKCRADGFREMYKWLIDRDILIIRADRSEPLVVLPLKLAAEIAAKAAGHA